MKILIFLRIIIKVIEQYFELTKGYTVSNSENLKMLHELKGLIDIYIKEFSNDDKMKISFLIDNLSKEL